MFLRLLTEVLPVLRLQSDLQELVLVDDAVVLTNKPGKTKTPQLHRRVRSSQDVC